MLVHTSRLVNWQRHIGDIVQNAFDFYRRGIEMNIPSVVDEIRQAFEEYDNLYKSYRTTSQLILNSSLSDIDPYIQVYEWNDVLPFLNEAATRIQVREINGGSADVLTIPDYTLPVIPEQTRPLKSWKKLSFWFAFRIIPD